MSPTSYPQALSSLTRLLALLKNISEVPKRQVVKTADTSISVSDGRYVVNALHCDVCSLCMPSGVHGCLFHWFLGQCFLVEVHPYMTCFCTFWQSAFSVISISSYKG